MPSTTVAAEVHAKPSRRPPCGLPRALLLRVAASTGQHHGRRPSPGGSGHKGARQKTADARPEGGLARGSRLVSPPRPLLLLLLFQTEHARGDGTCARRGTHSAAKPEARARGAGLGRVAGAQQRERGADLGLVLGACLLRRPSATAPPAARPHARRARAGAPGGRAIAGRTPPTPGPGPGAGAHAPSSKIGQSRLN